MATWAILLVLSGITQCCAQTACSFLSKADIVFALDASSSESAMNFQKQLDFVLRTVNDFNIGTSNVRIGALTFSTSVNLEFDLNQYSTKAQVLDHVQRISYMGGATNTALALKYVSSHMFAHGSRSGVKQYLIILTDGSSDEPLATLPQANQLKGNGVVIMVVGIGSRINKAELVAMASDVSMAFSVTNFDALTTIRDKLRAAACKGILSNTPIVNTPAATTMALTTNPTTATPAVVTTPQKTDQTVTSTAGPVTTAICIDTYGSRFCSAPGRCSDPVTAVVACSSTCNVCGSGIH